MRRVIQTLAMTQEPNEVERLEEALAEAEQKLEEEKQRTSTTLTGQELIHLLLTLPIILAFVVLGIRIIWATTANPESIAPHLDIILLAFAIFSTPTTIIINSVVGKKGNDKT